jgi:hypothetical protein
MAGCQIASCSNIGVYSCSGCGKLFCGVHGRLRSAWSEDLNPHCDYCVQSIRTEEKKGSRQLIGGGCLIFIVGVVILAICIPLEAWIGVAVGALAILGGLWVAGLSVYSDT